MFNYSFLAGIWTLLALINMMETKVNQNKKGVYLSPICNEDAEVVIPCLPDYLSRKIPVELGICIVLRGLVS